MGLKVGIDDLSSAIEKHLEDYAGQVQKVVRKETDKAMRELVKETKATAPKREGSYQKAITSKVTTDSARAYIKTWYVKAPHYRLSHLLEFGHQMRQGGRAKGTYFITRASASVTQKYLDRIRKGLENA